MKINKLQLVNFRNYDHCAVAFDKMVTVFYGKNGQGKTNILEGIFYSAFGLSHRTAKEDELLKFSSEGMAVLLDFTKEDGNHSIRMKRYFDQGKYHKEIKIDGKRITAKDHYGYLNAVMFSPEDLQIIKGDPGLRRRFMDMEISQTDPLYYELLVRYRRLLKQRNSLLKVIRENNQSQAQLNPWDEEIADTCTQILIKRLFNVKKLKEICIPVFHILSNHVDGMEIKYEMKGNNGELFYPEEENVKDIKEFYLKSLNDRRFKDIMQGNTGIGIHRDDILIKLDDLEMKKFSSQGQQRTAALALKLSELEIIKMFVSSTPILILDDVFSELDKARRLSLVQAMKGAQIFITCTDKNMIGEEIDAIEGANKTEFYRVDGGNIAKEA